MYIKSIVLDGFKSYAERTEVSGFDPLFNAITGLNGSGKSNILDSICFVLGISNLHHVRATNLQELVYKNGQSGITKASVSVTFDNSDPDQCPFGYSQYDEIVVTRQVVVGGRNKYMINGTAASNQKVADLFKSVSLNIDNPHFLIMQGRITKVLNMKPPEILSMIEEAAGTRLYESKRVNAEKIIEKKESKLKEVDALIEEETASKLDRLKKERDAYIEYQKIVRELEHLNRLHVAWQFVCAEKEKVQSADELKKLHDTVTQLQDRCTEISETVKQLDAEIVDMERRIQDEQNDLLTELETKLHDRQQADAVASSNHNDCLKDIKSQEKRLKELTKHMTDDSAALKKKKDELDANTKQNASAVEETTKAKEAYATAQKKYQTESAGLASNDSGEDATLNDQLLAAKNAISQAETDIKNSQMTIKHSQDEVKKRKSELKKSSADYDRDKANLDNVTRQIKQMEEKQSKLKFDKEAMTSMKEKQRALQTEVDSLSREYERMADRFPQLDFDYVDPVKNFDRRKVRGPVAKLIQVKDPSTATALEVVAGGRLYNIVVDDDATAQQLLDKGQLKRKYTILPLNKLTARPMDSKIVSKAKKLVGNDNVNLALQLVGYEKHVEAAMAHVFGNTFVCADSQSARSVTFDKEILRKSVTLGGDSFDPAGTLTGGSRPQSSGILSKLSEINELSIQLENKKRMLLQMDGEAAAVSKVADQFEALESQLSIKRREAEMISGKLKQTTHGAQLEHIRELEETIERHQQSMEQNKELVKVNKKKAEDLEYQTKNAAQLREQRLKQLEQELSNSKKHLDNLEKKYAKAEQQSATLKLEVEELEKDLESIKTQIAEVEADIQSLKDKADSYKKEVTETRAAVAEVTAQLKHHKSELALLNKEIANKIAEQKRLKTEYTDNSLKIEDLAHHIETVKSGSKSAARQVENLVQKHDWINDEKQYFGQPDTAFDFTANPPKETSRTIAKLQERRQGLERTVNMRAMTMLDKAQAQHNELLKKRRILVQDKEKMAGIINDLNEKKNVAVEKAYRQVNKDFTAIFSMLLPGATAKLSPPDGATCLDGLEVKVGFGDVWKESLAELSGGQRSLVALSLILAMLLFKPAPLYILDEVDAALDLSHTQNIGHMLKTHFTRSQFIVVSLKDGMFTNANVLFRTRFVDGMSMVTRYTQNTQKKQQQQLPLAERKQTGTSGQSAAVTKTSKKKTTESEDKRKRIKS